MFEVAIVGHRFVLYYISFVLIDVQSSQMLRTNVVQKGFHPFSLSSLSNLSSWLVEQPAGARGPFQGISGEEARKRAEEGRGAKEAGNPD